MEHYLNNWPPELKTINAGVILNYQKVLKKAATAVTDAYRFSLECLNFFCYSNEIVTEKKKSKKRVAEVWHPK